MLIAVSTVLTEESVALTSFRTKLGRLDPVLITIGTDADAIGSVLARFSIGLDSLGTAPNELGSMMGPVSTVLTVRSPVLPRGAKD